MAIPKLSFCGCSIRYLYAVNELAKPSTQALFTSCNTTTVGFSFSVEGQDVTLIATHPTLD